MTFEDKKMPKNADDFYCQICDFSCSKKSNFNKHMMTRKHEINQNQVTNDDKIMPKNADNLTCICGKKYKYRQGLWSHKQKCKYINSMEENVNIDKDLIMSVMKQNNELQIQLVELLKNGTHNTSFTNNNSHNKTFNLQFFLNDTCKDAMNLTDFVQSLKIRLDDLEKMGDIGYVNGMSNIILNSLKDMDVSERPVHCTDKKRETLYVKDDGSWNKETDHKPKMRKAIKHIARKNALLLNEFKEKHPDCMKSDSVYADTYNKVIIEAMGGKDYDEAIHENKIIKNISQQIIVDK